MQMQETMRRQQQHRISITEPFSRSLGPQCSRWASSGKRKKSCCVLLPLLDPQELPPILVLLAGESMGVDME